MHVSIVVVVVVVVVYTKKAGRFCVASIATFGYVWSSPNAKIRKSTNGTIGNTERFSGTNGTIGNNGTIGRSHGGIFIILINTHHSFLSFLFSTCVTCNCYL